MGLSYKESYNIHLLIQNMIKRYYRDSDNAKFLLAEATIQVEGALKLWLGSEAFQEENNYEDDLFRRRVVELLDTMISWHGDAPIRFWSEGGPKDLVIAEVTPLLESMSKLDRKLGRILETMDDRYRGLERICDRHNLEGKPQEGMTGQENGENSKVLRSSKIRRFWNFLQRTFTLKRTPTVSSAVSSIKSSEETTEGTSQESAPKTPIIQESEDNLELLQEEAIETSETDIVNSNSKAPICHLVENKVDTKIVEFLHFSTDPNVIQGQSSRNSSEELCKPDEFVADLKSEIEKILGDPTNIFKRQVRDLKGIVLEVIEIVRDMERMLLDPKEYFSAKKVDARNFEKAVDIWTMLSRVGSKLDVILDPNHRDMTNEFIYPEELWLILEKPISLFKAGDACYEILDNLQKACSKHLPLLSNIIAERFPRGVSLVKESQGRDQRKLENELLALFE